MKLRILHPIRKIWRESIWSWAFRLAVSVTVPLLYGYFTDNLANMFWVSLAAQSLGLIELKGNFGNVLRVLLLGSLFSILTCIIGTITGDITALHVILMFFVGFLSTLFKNLGERGMGMALSFYIFYIITSSAPSREWEEVFHRVELVMAGQLWVIFLAILWMMIEKQGRPLRATVSQVFHEMSVLTNRARSGFGGEGIFISLRNLFLQENKVRSALNSSIELFNIQDKELYDRNAVEQTRKIAGMLNIQILDIIEETRLLIKDRKTDNVDVHVHSIMRLWEQIFDLTDQYLYGLRSEDKLLLYTRLERLKDISDVICKSEFSNQNAHVRITKILRLSGRMIKLVERLIEIMESTRERRTFQTYSFSKAMSILHPRLFGNELTNFFRFEKSTSAYALRVGIGVTIGAIIDHLFFTHHGYWIPFTTIIVAQPYIGATVKRGLERSLGTFFGVIAGFIFFEVNKIDFVNIILVFVSTSFCIYFLRKNYSVSSFFVTLSLIGLLSISHNSADNILTTRLVCTIIGTVISIGIGFLFMSTWDESMMPQYFANALRTNYEYWKSSPVLNNKLTNWLRLKRLSESANVKLYESYSRWINEPKLNRNKKEIARYFSRIAHIIRITKEINNINLEWELQTGEPDHLAEASSEQTEQLFRDILEQAHITPVDQEKEEPVLLLLNPNQKISLDKLNLELTALRNSIHHKTDISDQSKLPPVQPSI